MSKLTWQELVQREPRLDQLLRKAQAIKDDKRKKSFCANAQWYGYGCPGLRPVLLSLVGWESRSQDPVIRSPQAYDLATDKIYKALPDCRNCGCF